MTKYEALDNGYCKHCAAYGGNYGWRCGILNMVGRQDVCLLPAEAVERYRTEFGLEGVTQRFTGDFGDRELMKKKRGRKEKRYLK